MSKVCTIGFMLTLLSVSYASSSSSSHSNSNSVFISSSESSDVWDGIEEYDPNIPCDTNLAQGKIDWLCNITNKGSLKTSDACTKKIIGNNVSIECGLLRNTSAECIVVVTTVFIKQDDNLNLNISALDGFEDFVYLKKL